MAEDWTRVVTSYDTVADAYVDHVHGELEHKPFDRAWLTDFADRVTSQGLGPVCELGCGPGHVGQFLYDAGCPSVTGLDLSPAMIARARTLHPELSFAVDNMCHLATQPDDAWGAIAAFYALVNLNPAQRAQAFAAITRVLRPGGLLTLAYHVGDEVTHLQDWWGHKVDIDFFAIDPASIRELATQHGYTILRDEVRGPIPDVEYPSQRAYQLVRLEPG